MKTFFQFEARLHSRVRVAFAASKVRVWISHLEKWGNNDPTKFESKLKQWKGCWGDSSGYGFHLPFGVTVYRMPPHIMSPTHMAKHSLKLKEIYLVKVLVWICKLPGMRIEDVHIL